MILSIRNMQVLLVDGDTMGFIKRNGFLNVDIENARDLLSKVKGYDLKKLLDVKEFKESEHEISATYKNGTVKTVSIKKNGDGGTDVTHSKYLTHRHVELFNYSALKIKSVVQGHLTKMYDEHNNLSLYHDEWKNIKFFQVFKYNENGHIVDVVEREMPW